MLSLRPSFDWKEFIRQKCEGKSFEAFSNLIQLILCLASRSQSLKYSCCEQNLIFFILARVPRQYPKNPYLLQPQLRHIKISILLWIQTRKGNSVPKNRSYSSPSFLSSFITSLYNLTFVLRNYCAKKLPLECLCVSFSSSQRCTG